MQPSSPDHGKYGDLLKASPPHASCVVELIPSRVSLASPTASSAPVIKATITSPSTELTRYHSTSSSLQTSSPSVGTSSQGILSHPILSSSFSLSPCFSSVALIGKASLVKLPPVPHNSHLMLTHLEHPRLFQVQLFKKTWSTDSILSSVPGPTVLPIRTVSSQLDVSKVSSVATIPLLSSSTCPVAFENRVLSILLFPLRLIQNIPLHPYQKNAFILIPLLTEKKSKVEDTSSSVPSGNGSSQNVGSYSSSILVSSKVGVAGFILPPPPP